MDYLEIIGVIVGIVYLVLEYRASYYLWIAGIIMPAIYLFIYFDAKLYADFGINVYYCMASVYGMVMWKWKGQTKEVSDSLRISHLPLKYYLPTIVAFGILFWGIAQILIRFTDSNVPWLDSFTTSLSIVAMWMLAHKYIEQWLAWIAVDFVSARLYEYKELNLTALLYFAYGIIAIFGYLKWKKLMKEEV